MAILVESDRRPEKRARLTFQYSNLKREELGCLHAHDVPSDCAATLRPPSGSLCSITSTYSPQMSGICGISADKIGYPVAMSCETVAHGSSVLCQVRLGTNGTQGEHEFRPDGGRAESIPVSCSSCVNGSTRDVSPPRHEDDKDGHFMFELGENITSRYKILKKMGEGTFGKVLECWDREAQECVAIKVIRSVQKYRDAAMIEIDVLRVLAKHDRIGTRGCVRMKHWFDYRNHICIVCELLGSSLYDFLRKNSYKPFPTDFVCEFGRQLLESVAYMHDLTLIHTDLKPENVLLVSSDYIRIPDFKASQKRFKRLPKSRQIKLIDFGSATFESQYHCSVVSTRHYRAPEVILGLGWSYPCDLWSVGCILVELCSGEALFQTHENLEHLAMMERVMGPLPQHMIKRADCRAEKYFRHGRRELHWPEGAASRESVRAVRKLPRLRNLIMQHVDHSAGALIDLLQGLLKFDPTERLTAKDALRHPFFRGQR